MGYRMFQQLEAVKSKSQFVKKSGKFEIFGVIDKYNYLPLLLITIILVI